MNEKKEKESKLLLIPKTEKYIEYMLQVIFKLPRIEKYSIGTEFKTSMYQMLRLILLLNKKGKGYRKEVILFNLKQEEYLYWLLEQLKNGTYKHGGYTTFYITEPKVRKIEKSRYIDRIVHRWVVDNFLEPYFVPQFIPTSFACIKGKGMHKACLYVQSTMKHCQRIWKDYYILKMDIAKYFDSIDKGILMNILKRKIKDKKLAGHFGYIKIANVEYLTNKLFYKER